MGQRFERSQRRVDGKDREEEDCRETQWRLHEADDARPRARRRDSVPNRYRRTEVTQKLWVYIKKNGLQDAKEQRRIINADPALKTVFGGKSIVSMFEMTKLVGKHLQ